MGQAVLSREELGKELAELEKQLEACCTLCADSIQTVVSSACSLRVEGRERIEKVMERLQSLETEDSYVQTVRENQEEELHKFKQQMSETQASLDYLHKHNSLLLQKKENREKLISTLMADVTSKMSSKKQKVAALHEATTWYKQLLSMHCEYSDVVECNPRVEASANLVEALNQSNEFSWFVRSMHREFEGMAMRSLYQVS
ncbi:hypothetical protein CY35_12G057600 [Sphagnum magellanicum]|nr:hypothetical protein CY35_12G057600 [Sphagnum magellanicum]KAH9545624.1 hypothetical protein CY35_12G057600 [Sphagnum magellanicum]KAH9545625.1 hypothetical protein CY35_12G057600 [Sphagnum magellanicum]